MLPSYQPINVNHTKDEHIIFWKMNEDKMYLLCTRPSSDGLLVKKSESAIAMRNTLLILFQRVIVRAVTSNRRSQTRLQPIA